MQCPLASPMFMMFSFGSSEPGECSSLSEHRIISSESGVRARGEGYLPRADLGLHNAGSEVGSLTGDVRD